MSPDSAQAPATKLATLPVTPPPPGGHVVDVVFSAVTCRATIGAVIECCLSAQLNSLSQFS